MHFFSRRNASLALSLAAVGVLAACGDDVTVPIAPPTPVLISITPQAVTLNPGQTGTLSVQITGGDPRPSLATCSSSTPAVATAVAVSASNTCTVTAVATGNATVTATTSTGESASAAVTVNQLPAALGELTVSPSMSNLVGGQTLQLVPNANAASSGVTIAYQYTSSNPSVASVNASGLVTAGAVGNAVITVQATGTGTGFSSATRTTTATVNVLSAPSGITTLSASPTSLVLATQGTGAIAASVQQPNGAPAAVITFGTTNPAVATVAADANNANLATVTGVSQGTATITVTATSPAGSGFSASTLTQLISVTVSAGAQVSIGNITRGTTNEPVDISDVRGQIQVPVNITTNGQNVQSAQLYVCEQGEALDACITRSGGPAAQQSFGASGANSGTINLFINTAEFTTAADFSDAVVKHTNGQKVLIATLTVAGQSTVATNNLAILNFNNTDGFAARHTPPDRNAVNVTTNTTFFGGPGEEGRGEITVVPVIYTEGRTIQRVTVGLTGVCSSSRNLTFITGTDDRPWTYTYGYSVSTSTSTTTQNAENDEANNIVCRQQSDGAEDPDVAPRVVSSIDNSQNAGPVVTMASNFRTSTSNSPAVLIPASIRVDYVGPTATQPDIRNTLPAVTGWVNGSFDFASNTSDATDAGVGVDEDGRAFQVTGCGSDAFTALADGTASSLNECAADATGGYDEDATADQYGAKTRGPYRIRSVESDLLDNTGNSALSSRFGVDKTAPFIRWSAASAADTTVLDATSGAVIFQAEFIDERAGFIDDNDLGQVDADSVVIDNQDGSQYHFASRALGDSITVSPTTKAYCMNPNSFTPLANRGATNNAANRAAAAGAAFQTNPNCSFRVVGFGGGNLGLAPEGDGYRAGIGATLAQDEGIYHYATRVYDRAGNSSEILRRRLAVDETAGLIANLSVPSPISASANPVLTYSAQDNVEIRATSIVTDFNSALTNNVPFAYEQVLVDARFNDNINSPVAQAQTSLNTPLPVLIGLTGDVNATTPVFDRLNTVQLTGYDVANIATNSLSGGFLSQGLPSLGGALAGAGNYQSWAVNAERTAGFNAPEGLKAQLIANTNVTNSPFSRVEFYRLTEGAVGSEDPTWQYLGSTSTAIPADQGATRYWTYVLADANYAGVPTDFGSTQDAATDGDQIVAVGVRANGAGFITGATTIGGDVDAAERIQFTIAGLPTGAAGEVTVTNGLGFTLTQSVGNNGFVTVPSAGQYFVSANSVVINNVRYNVVSVNPANVDVTEDGTAGPVTVTYAVAATQISVTVSGIIGTSSGTFTITGPNAYSQTFTRGNGVTTINVPVAGAYTVTATSPQTIAADVYTVTTSGAAVVTEGATPTAATVTFTNTTPRFIIRAIAPAGVTPDIDFNCNSGAFTGTVVATGEQIIRPGAGNTACVVSPQAVIVGEDTYVATISGDADATTGAITATTANPSPTAIVTYALTVPAIVVTDAPAATPNNLPNGLEYTIRVTSSAFSGGFRDFTKMTGTDLVIPVALANRDTIYNVSVPQTFTSGTQEWTTAAASVSVTGGATPPPVITIEDAAGSVVVSNLRSTLTPSGTGVGLRPTVRVIWTGPNPIP